MFCKFLIKIAWYGAEDVAWVLASLPRMQEALGWMLLTMQSGCAFPVLGRWEQDDQKVMVIVGYKERLRPAWGTWDAVSENKCA